MVFGRIKGRIKKEKEILNLFREKGALSVELAKDLREIGEMNRIALSKFVAKGVIERGGGNTFFLNEHALMKYRMERVKWSMIILFALLAMVLLFGGKH